MIVADCQLSLNTLPFFFKNRTLGTWLSKIKTISFQPPLQLSVATGLSSGQWDVRESVFLYLPPASWLERGYVGWGLVAIMDHKVEKQIQEMSVSDNVV